MGLKETVEFLEGKKPVKVKGKPADAPKRGHYKERECPYCHKMVRNLKNHIAQAHPADPGKPPPPPSGPVELTKDNLLGGGPRGDAGAAPGQKTYYCTDCKAELRKGENPCWHCNATLNWEGIE